MEIAGIELETLELDTIGSWPPLFKRLTLGVASVLVLLAGYGLFLSDQILHYSDTSKRVETLHANFVDTQRKVASLENYKKEVAVVGGELNKVTEQLPQSNEEAGLLEDLSQQASSYKLQFVSLKPGTPENKGFYKINPIEITLSGEYNGLSEFASNVSNMSRIVTFHDFEIKRNTTEGKGTLMMVVQAKTYWAVSKGQGK